MNITVMRRIRFCAGHRLLGHEGKCANFHGHSYSVDFYVSPLGEDSSRVDDVGRVIDFAELKIAAQRLDRRALGSRLSPQPRR